MRERRPGVFEIRVAVGVDPVSGRTVQRSFWFHGALEDAEKRRKELAKQFAEYRAVRRAAPFLTVGELLERWMAAHHDWRPSTWSSARSNVKALTADAIAGKTGVDLAARGRPPSDGQVEGGRVPACPSCRVGSGFSVRPSVGHSPNRSSIWRTPVETDPTRALVWMIGLPDDHVPGRRGRTDGEGRIHVETNGHARRAVRGAESLARVKDRSRVELVDLPLQGRPTRLVWHKRRWMCPDVDCPMGSWTEDDDRIAASRQVLTSRAARWVTEQVGRHARSVNEVAVELGCDWHTVNDTVVAYGEALLDADADRIRRGQRPRARRGAHGAGRSLSPPALLHPDRRRPSRPAPRRRPWSRQCRAHGLAGRTGTGVPGRASSYGTLDLSGPYRRVFEVMVPEATLVADPFHVVKLANTKLDECRRRVQNETLGHRGRKSDPLYRCRRLLDQGQGATRRQGTREAHRPPRAGDPTRRRRHAAGRPRRPSASSTPTPIPTSPSSG